MTNNNLTSEFSVSERFPSQTMNNLDIYDKIYRDQGGRTAGRVL